MFRVLPVCTDITFTSLYEKGKYKTFLKFLKKKKKFKKFREKIYPSLFVLNNIEKKKSPTTPVFFCLFVCFFILENYIFFFKQETQ